MMKEAKKSEDDRFVAFLWHQGEHEVGKENPPEIYESQLKEIRNYISKLVSINAGKGAKTPLCPHRMEELEGKLLIKAVKAAKRHNSALSPLIPFIKRMLKIEVAREAARLFSKQIKKGETPLGESSLDANPSQDEEGRQKECLIGSVLNPSSST